MKASKDLDILVTEKVMRWRRAQDRHPEIEAAGGIWMTPRGPRVLPPFSHDLTRAWEIVEWAQRYGYQVTLHTTHPDTGQWVCVLRGAVTAVSAQGDTAPLAICLAALRAVGIEVWVDPTTTRPEGPPP